MKKSLCALFVFCLLLFCAAAHGEGKLRALLVGCDRFLSYDVTEPVARLNVERIGLLLQSDSRIFDLIVTADSGVGGVAELSRLTRETFSGAEEGDISLIYICTHGQMDRVTGQPSLILSDGQVEEELRPAQLRLMTDGIKGTCVILLDACNGGAFIGKGLKEGGQNIFHGDNYKVLTSASAGEDSLLWNDLTGSAGGSYFASELCAGLADRTFDIDMDGRVTLTEASRGLLESHGASTVQCYPQEDDFVLYQYEP